MKVLILANNDVGLYNFRHELTEKLLENNEVHIALPDGPKIKLLVKSGCIYHDICLQRRKKNPFMDLFLMHQIKSLAEKINPDLIITYTIKPNIYGGLVCQLLRIPYCSNITGLGTAFQKDNLLRKLVILLYRVSLRKAKTVFFENLENLRIFTCLGIVNEKNSYLLNGAGVNTDDYSYLPYPKLSSNQPVRFLFVGRVMKEKGIEELLRAVRILKAMKYNLILDVVGDCEENYSSVLKEYQDEGLIYFHGFQENVLPFLQYSSCLVLPSWHEGMANTILEAASCGRPVIASNIPGCRESVDHGKTGYLCQVKSSEDLKQQMVRFLELTDEEKILMGKKGRQKMVREFEKKIIVQQTVDRITDVIGRE